MKLNKTLKTVANTGPETLHTVTRNTPKTADARSRGDGGHYLHQF
jgi:hypothetical protein